jgi:predicted amino acid dehydrogenase
VKQKFRIACLDPAPDTVAATFCIELPDATIEWDRLTVLQNPELIGKRIPELLQDYDAVALQGISSSFRIGKRIYFNENLRHQLRLDDYGDRFSDGSTLLATLERYIVQQAAEQLPFSFKDKSILFFSGLNRYGSAEVLSKFTKKLVFGDMLYGFRLGIPINSFSHLESSAPQLVKAVMQAPASWFWPSVRRSKRLMPRFQFYFKRADIIVGGLSYFKRYKPDTLARKTVFTNIRDNNDLELFRDLEVEYVVSLSPRINDVFTPVSVLEAAFKLCSAGAANENIEDYFLQTIHRMELRPDIFCLSPHEEKEDLTSLQLPNLPDNYIPREEVVDVAEDVETDVARFAFVIHPLVFSQVRRLKSVKAMSHFMPERLIEDTMAQVSPFPCAMLKNVVSKTGARAEGILYVIPMTSRAIMRFPAEFLYKKLVQIAETASQKGCRIMGLGAYTSVVGDAGETVSKRSPIGITSGNSYTVASTIRTMEVTAGRCNIDIASSAACVVGATGSIGSICARLLAEKVEKLYLVSPRPERLLALSALIEKETPRIKGRVQISRNAADFLGSSDLIITTTSAVDPVVDVTGLRPGCIVCDVARPPDIREAEAARRNDILVIESGEIRLPEGSELNYDIGLPPQTIYACMAETLLLALERRFDHYTIGRDIEPAKVKEIQAIGDRHGFELADIRSFGKVVPEEQFERMRRISGSGNRRSAAR